jgi:prophage antirepressor
LEEIEMQEVKLFENEEFGQVRMIIIENEPWFVGKDVAEALGYERTADAIRQHVETDDKGVGEIQTPGGKQNMILINESGLYALIFGSKLESAKRFKHWVTSEILPSIRKHGIYATDNVIDNILNNPDFGIELLTKLKEERAARVEAEKKNAILTHVNKTYTMTEIAKELNLKSATELNKILADKHIQYKVNNTWVFYSDYSNLGYEDIKQEVLDNGHVIYHRKITQMGRAFILGLFKEAVA